MTESMSPIKVPFVDLLLQHQRLLPELQDAFLKVIDQSDFILGAAVERFEQEFAAYLKVQHVIGVATGLDALRLSLVALGVGEGDEVILPANTFIATALAVSAINARPVLVDCRSDTYNISAEQLEGAISPRTKAIIPVHLMGQPADMPTITAIARRHRLVIVEDACQAHGAEYGGQACGTFGQAGCFSFYPAKNLGCFGDGGAIVTGQAELAEHLRQLRNYGQSTKNHHKIAGTNSRLDTVQAAILIVKLKYLSPWNEQRRRHAASYRRLLEGVGDLTFQQSLQHTTPVYHLFAIETEHRDALRDFLFERGVHTGIHYPTPIHLQPAYAYLGYKSGDFPVAERLATRSLSLPMYPELNDDQIEYVVRCVREFF